MSQTSNSILLVGEIYGTIKHGHALRCASGDRQFAGELAQRLDLPDTEPQGADWSPVTSGFAVRIRDHMPRYRHLFAIENDAVHISVNVPVRFASSVRDAALLRRVTPNELIFTAVSHELEIARESAA